MKTTFTVEWAIKKSTKNEIGKPAKNAPVDFPKKKTDKKAKSSEIRPISTFFAYKISTLVNSWV